MNTKSIPGLFAAFLIGFAANAQQYSLKQSPSDLKGPQHEILLCPGGDHIIVTYPFDDDKDPMTISRFDQSLDQQYVSSVGALARQHYQAAMYGNDRLFIFANDKDGAVSGYEIDDKTGALATPAVPLFNLPGKEDDATFFSGSAPGKGFHYLLAQGHDKKEKGMILQGVILDQQCRKLSAFSFVTPEDRGDFQHLDAIQANNGVMILIYSVKVKTTKDNYTPNAYTVVLLDTKGKTVTFPLTGIPEGDLRNLSWSIQGGHIVFTGFLAPGKKMGFTTILTGAIDPIHKKVGNLQQTEVSSLLTKAPDFVKDLTAKGLPTDISLIKTLNLPDGSRALVLEDNSDKLYQSYYAPAFNPVPYNPTVGSFGHTAGMSPGVMTPSYSMVYHNRNNNYIVKLDQNNVPQWINLVSKKQQEGDLAIAIGTACATDNKGNIYLFFYDDKKNTEVATAKPRQVDGYRNKHNLLACVSIAPDGSMKKQMQEQQDHHFRIMLEKSVTGSSNEVYFLAIRSKKAFSKEHLFNHAKFHLGEVAIDDSQLAGASAGASTQR
jgi:hypothetical protein